MKLYIHRSASVSAQRDLTPSAMTLLGPSNSHPAAEPDYSRWLNPAASRRMSRIIKMGVTSALQCLQEGDNRLVPDAIISGTGFGCFEDSEKFLGQMIRNGETTLSPTPFIQSTHNTVGAQIALLTGCNGLNFTHVHGGLSFENALIHTSLWFSDHPGTKVLTGAADELTPGYIRLRIQDHFEMNESDGPLNLGEGAAYFLISDHPENAAGCISGTETRIETTGEGLNAFLTDFLNKHNLPPDRIHLVLDGGWSEQAGFNGFGGYNTLEYKKYIGSFYTASAPALDLALAYLRENPRYRNILLANAYAPSQYSLILLTHV